MQINNAVYVHHSDNPQPSHLKLTIFIQKLFLEVDLGLYNDG